MAHGRASSWPISKAPIAHRVETCAAPMRPLTLTERTLVGTSISHLSGRSLDLAMALSLALLTLELGVRSVGSRYRTPVLATR